MSIRQKNILLSTVALLIGGTVYLLFREDAYLSHSFNGLPLLAKVRNMLDGTVGVRISYYLPDLLWAFSLCCGIQAIYLPKGRGLYAAAAVSFACGVVWELLQWTAVVSGTGDFWDVEMYFLGSTLAIMMNIRREKHEEA